MEYQCPAELSHCVCMCVRVLVCVCPAAIRWHLTCSRVWSGYLCVAMCACLPVSLIGRESHDCICLSWPFSVSAARSPPSMPARDAAGCVGCLAEQQPFLSSCRVVWSVCAQPSVPAQLSPCVESMGSPKRLLCSTALPCVGGEWALPPIYLPLIYCCIAIERVYHMYCIIILVSFRSLHMHLSF